MIDPSLLVSGVDTVSPPVQDLPPPETSDVMRFEEVITGQESVSSSVSSANDIPPLQLIGDDTAVSTGETFHDRLLNQVAAMDQSYSDVVTNLVDRPSLSEYFKESGGLLGNNEVRTYPEVSSEIEVSSENMAEHFDQLLTSIQDKQEAAVEYQQDMTRWTIGAEMWMTQINVLSSAVNQVAQGFKTLFRAGG